MTEVHLELNINFDHRNCPFLRLDEVDAILQNTSFSRLEDVTVRFFVHNWRGPMFSMAQLPSYLTTQLQLCNARGILSFDCFKGRPWDSYL
jgi:hypothetical protein